MVKLRLTLLFCALAWTNTAATRGADLAEEFRRPPDSARPWVYCFWLEGNVTREGITADLEAMRRAGVGGLLFMDGGMGNPAGAASLHVRIVAGDVQAHGLRGRSAGAWRST